eukprot:COSAG01_NODE_3737_length_5747_cov_40.714058_6_plen_178_part_00
MRKHVTITPQQAEQIKGMGRMMHGAGMIPSNFDDDDEQWQDHTFVDFPIYVSKGRGKYHGQGGGLTSLLKLLFNKAKGNPEVRKLAKKAVKAGVEKASSAVKAQASKRGASGPMLDMAIGAATKKAHSEIDKHLGAGRRMRVNGFGTQGVRMSGRGHCSGGAMVIPGRRGSGMYAPH